MEQSAEQSHKDNVRSSAIEKDMIMNLMHNAINTLVDMTGTGVGMIMNLM